MRFLLTILSVTVLVWCTTMYVMNAVRLITSKPPDYLDPSHKELVRETQGLLLKMLWYSTLIGFEFAYLLYLWS